MNAECDGCRNGGTQNNGDCWHLQAPEVYACTGSWSDCGLSEVNNCIIIVLIKLIVLSQRKVVCH